MRLRRSRSPRVRRSSRPALMRSSGTRCTRARFWRSSERRSRSAHGGDFSSRRWVTAAVGMACGAGLPLLAIAVTAANFAVVFGFRPLERWLPKSRWAPLSLRVSYEDGRGILRDILAVCTDEDFAVTGVEVERGGERVFDRRGKHTGRARAKEAADAAEPWRDATSQLPRRRRRSRSRSNCAAAGLSRGSSTSSARSTVSSRSTRATRA